MTQGPPPSGFSERSWTLTTLLRPHTEDFWLYYAPRNGAGPEQLRVCERSGYDFARLTWQSCAECRRGHIMKIRVTDEWQRQGYGTRMVLRAMRGCESYTWTTTPQSEDARRFFPALSTVVGTGFPVNGACGHHARGGGYAKPRLEGRPDAS
ncbi:GNAT family N-acetyltransferase [Streptomyces flavidovirens]|uniref:GNAT family N-acetyltransferase n=1 Tax=Streptomyces flavidovirens TaxID=67298 RepID=UPI0033B84FE4